MNGVMDARFEVYPQRNDSDRMNPGELNGEFGWRFRAANGEISAVGGEGFTRREDAHRAIKDFLLAVGNLIYVPQIGTALDLGKLQIVDVEE